MQSEKYHGSQRISAEKAGMFGHWWPSICSRASARLNVKWYTVLGWWVRQNLVEGVTPLTGPSGLELGVYRHIVSARVSPIPTEWSHKNPLWRGTGNYLLTKAQRKCEENDHLSTDTADNEFWTPEGQVL